jgi:hypothetical protein
MFKIIFIIFFTLSCFNLRSGDDEKIDGDFSSDLTSFDEQISRLNNIKVKPLTKDTARKLMKNKFEKKDLKKTAKYILKASKLSKYADETRKKALDFAENTALKTSHKEAYEKISSMLNARANIAEYEKQKIMGTLLGQEEKGLEKLEEGAEKNRENLRSLISDDSIDEKKIKESLLADISMEKPDFSVGELPDDLEIQAERCCFDKKVKKGTCVDESGKDICTQFVLNRIEGIRANVIDANMLDNCTTGESLLNTVSDTTKIIMEDFLPSILLGKVDSLSSFGKAFSIAKSTGNKEALASLKAFYPDLYNVFEGNPTANIHTEGAGQLNIPVPSGASENIASNANAGNTSEVDIPGAGASDFFNGLTSYSDGATNTYSNIKGTGKSSENIDDLVATIYKSQYLSSMEKKLTGGRDFGDDEGSEESSDDFNYYTTENIVNTYSDMMENYISSKYDPFNSDALENYFKASYEFQILNSFNSFYNPYSNYTKSDHIFDLFFKSLYAKDLNNLNLVNPINPSNSIKFKEFLKELRTKIRKYKKKANLAKLKLRKILSKKIKYPKAPSTLKATKDLHDMEILKRSLNTNIYRINEAIKYHRSKKIYIPKKVYSDYENEYNVLSSSIKKTRKSVSRAKDTIQKSLPDIKSIEENKNKNIALRSIAEELLSKGL